MDRSDLDKAKHKLRDYLIARGYDPDKPMHCIFHHPDNHPSMTLLPDETAIFCHACKAHADIVNVIAELEGYAPNSKDAIKRAIEFAGTESTAPRAEPKKKAAKAPHVVDKAHWTTAFMNQYAQRYLTARGFQTNDTIIIEKFNLQFDPNTNCLIIPHDGDYYTARRIDDCPKSDRFKHNPATPVTLFNGDAINTDPIIAVTEGALDALSLIACGLPAVGLGGVANQAKFLKAIKATEIPPHIIIAFDNDDAGDTNAEKLEQKLDALKVCTYRLDFTPYHDANDALVANRADLQKKATEAKAALKDAVWTEPIIDPEPIENRPFGLPPKTTKLEETPAAKPMIADTDMTDYGIAQQIVANFKDILRYNYTNGGKFMIYTAPTWQLLNKDAELRILVNRFRENLNPASTLEHAIILKLSKNDNVSKTIAMIRSFEYIYTANEDFDTNDHLLNVANGILDLNTRAFYPHKGEYMFTRVANASYDPNAKCADFDRFIKSTLPDEETRNAIQRYLGYCLSGSIAEEKALFVVGSGGNGKGTLFRTVMQALGTFATPLKIDALLAAHRTQDGQSATPEFNKLEHTRLAVAEEVPKNRMLDAAQFKLLTGGDYLPIRRLHQEASVIKHVTHKLILSGNSLPQLSDPDDDGLKRRLMVVKFPNSFNGDTRDPNLKSKLSTPQALSAVLNWLLDGYEAYRRDGLKTSEDMDNTQLKYLADNDPINTFIEDYCRLDKDSITARKDLLRHVHQFGNYELRRRPDKEIVALFAKHPGIKYVRAKSGYAFKGIALVEQDE